MPLHRSDDVQHRPFGTHFLWHILLSTAAYLAIVFLIRQRTRLREV